MQRFTKIGAAGEALPADAASWDAVLDNATGLMWSARDAIDDEVKHAAAETVAGSLKLAGFEDWRLPSVEELFALADRTRHAPAIDTDHFPTCASDWYWTSTPWAPSSAGSAWIVDFHHGDSNAHGRHHRARVRAVRSASPAGQ